MTDIVYLLWSNKHSAWWKPGGWGYTEDIEEAGEFTEADAVDAVVRSAQCGVREHVSLMVAAPSNWKPKLPEMRIVAGPGPLAEVLPNALENLARAKRDGLLP